MSVRIRRVRAWSVFLVAGVIYGGVGLLVGAALAAVSTLPLPADSDLNVLNRLGAWSVAVFPVLYGLVGGTSAAVAAVLYNLAAAVTGGIRVDVPELERLLDVDVEPGAEAGPGGGEASGQPPSPGGADAAASSSSASGA